jgi:hypothetical protein
MPNYSGVWTLSQQFQGRGQGLWPTPPGAPTIGTATAGLALCASVAFTAPACRGVPSTITGYTVTSTPGSVTATGAASPIMVTGLTACTSYTFKVRATNATGTGACSAASNSVTAKVATCATFTTPGTYSWVAPAGVTSIAVLVVGGGGGGAAPGPSRGNLSGAGAGGGLAYRNAVSVTPGSSYSVTVGARGAAGVSPNGAGGNGGLSQFCKGGIAEARASGGGGWTCFQPSAGTVVFGAGGGTGGRPNTFSGGGNAGAGGAAGYSGAGGQGGYGSTPPGAGFAGAGGGGGGAGGSGIRYWCCGQTNWYGSLCGGGVGLFGEGANGFGGFVFGCYDSFYGGGGSGGTYPDGIGAGGGAGGAAYYPCSGTYAYSNGRAGGPGAVRIVWAGGSRGTPSFPSTNVGPS